MSSHPLDLEDAGRRQAGVASGSAEPGRVTVEVADHPGRTPLAALTLAAIGVVYGDIGTSPLYTMREALGAGGVLPLTEASVLGVLSLISWSLFTIVTLKYVIVILAADNRGEGGILALASLAHRTFPARPRRTVVVLAMCGAALFYGDGLITPAISVLSAVEGLRMATPLFEPYVVPIALVILIALFVIQSRGTGKIGLLFGPVVCVWFVVLGALGLAQILRAPEVLRALDPSYALSLLATHQWSAFVTLGAVFLAVTGAEALYADMGHFGRLPIRLAWFGLVLPGLLLNYFGQGALLLADPAAVANPFYLLAPAWALYPMVLLATAATVIASQAVISGAFSLSWQAVQLGYLPRLNLRHTSARAMGQIYIPRVNWMLLVGVVLLVLGFQSSTNLAAAYGIAVSATMAITAVLAGIVARGRWRWPLALIVLVFGGFLVLDLTFLAANALKIFAGGWFPILLAAALVVLMSTWRRGREVMFERLYRAAPSLRSFLTTLAQRPLARVSGTAVFLTANPDIVPRALLHNLKHNKILHERVVVLKVVTEEIPRVASTERVAVEHLGGNFHQVLVRYGFMEQPNVAAEILSCQLGPPELSLTDASFFLSRETFLPSARPDLAPWREQIFIHMANSALDATRFFRLPPDRVVEIGSQVEI
ncbi:MAG: kup1 [Geminicoccaceae bacterium]|nr:kup1 [Geminicoccaceae bacterium]